MTEQEYVMNAVHRFVLFMLAIVPLEVFARTAFATQGQCKKSQYERIEVGIEMTNATAIANGSPKRNRAPTQVRTIRETAAAIPLPAINPGSS
jgi:hypothetical protein